MSDDSARAIIAIVVVLVLLAIILIPIIALWVDIILQNGRRRKIRERILASRRDVIGNHGWFPARYASQPRFDALFKFFPWEAAGIIVTVKGSVLFLGKNFSGSAVTLQFAPGNSTVHWLGKCPWPNSPGSDSIRPGKNIISVRRRAY